MADDAHPPAGTPLATRSTPPTCFSCRHYYARVGHCMAPANDGRVLPRTRLAKAEAQRAIWPLVAVLRNLCGAQGRWWERADG